jgi:hypothetical protein
MTQYYTGLKSNLKDDLSHQDPPEEPRYGSTTDCMKGAWKEEESHPNPDYHTEERNQKEIAGGTPWRSMQSKRTTAKTEAKGPIRDCQNNRRSGNSKEHA